MGMRWWYILTGAIVIASFSFIWLLHPCSTASCSIWKNYTSAIVITVILISIILFWWIKLSSHGRKRLLHYLEKWLQKTFSKGRSLEEKTKALDDLVYLGEQGKPGDEKELVLKAFDHLAEYVHSSEQYRGVELEELIRGSETILVSKEKPGNENNFCTACNILKRILNRLYDLGLSSSLDADLTLKTLGRLGIVAIETKSESTALTFLEAVASDNNIIFQMGLSALRTKRFHIATASLNKLEALAEQSPQLTPDKTVHLFGLLSHFWTIGSSTRKRAKSFLFRMQGSFYPSLPECLNKAIDYHYNRTNYETSDALVVMLEDIRKGNLTLM
jgi:hypothetical protein